MTYEMGLAFKVMGYSTSDLMDATIPLAVIIEHRVESESHLAVYATKQKPEERIPLLHTVRTEIQSFFEDICKCPAGVRSELLFQHLGDLGIGPIRLVAQAVSKQQEIENQISGLCEQLWPDVSWPESFILL